MQRRNAWLWATPLAIALGFVGCSSNSDESDGEPGYAGETGAGGGDSDSDAGGAGNSARAGAESGLAGEASVAPTPGPDHDTQAIDASGGLIHVGYATLYVPEGALDEEVEISLTRAVSDLSVLDDVYELEPAGLVFAQPAVFVLDVGEELATAAGGLEDRELSYVTENLALPLGERAGFLDSGLLAGLVPHFSSVSAPKRNQSGSSPFSNLGNAQRYSFKSKCTELDSHFFPPEEGAPDPAAAETSVQCDISRLHFEPAPKQGGATCVSLTIPTNARKPQSSILYPDWTNPSKKCKAAWDDFINRLAEHEKQHRDIGMQGCADAYDAVSAEPVVACGKNRKEAIQAARHAMAVALENALAPVREKQEAIDVGKTHGVTMDCDCECEDPCTKMNRETAMCEPIECEGDCQKCVEGECQEDPECGCVPPDAEHCPVGSSWDQANQRCAINCVAGGKIGEFACVYSGTATGTAQGSTFTTTAKVDLKAKEIEGCHILYEAVAGTITATTGAEDCVYQPDTKDVLQTMTTTNFVIVPDKDPYLIADSGSTFDTNVVCKQATVASKAGGIWMYTLHSSIAPNAPIVGTDTAGGFDFSWSFAPK